jgi:SAM-dependent methyltransferase
MKIKEALRKIPFTIELYRFTKGLLSFIKPSIASHDGGSGGATGTAPYCYSVWMGHLCRLEKAGLKEIPQSLAEFGPGDSLGTGLCAMLSGVDRYYAFDIVAYANPEKNLAVFEELVALFQKGGGESELLTAEVLAKTLAEERLDKIRALLSSTAEGANSRDEMCIQYVAPWEDNSKEADFPSVGLILSHAVLEHVGDLDNAYRVMSQMLEPGGVMSHVIDFRSHDMTRKWNGHWSQPEWLWRITWGNFSYTINREPLTTHLDLLEKHGFELLHCERKLLEKGAPYTKRSQRFKGISEEDFRTGGADIISARSGGGCGGLRICRGNPCQGGLSRQRI